MNHGLTTTGAALLDRISQGIQKHPKRITALVAALLLTGGGGAFAVASLAPDPADLPVRMIEQPIESLASGTTLAALTEQQTVPEVEHVGRRSGRACARAPLGASLTM